MSRYLIVTHQTARSLELQSKVAALIEKDPSAEFAILVPEEDGQTRSWEGESVDVVQQRGEAAAEQLHHNVGANVVRIVVGSSDPLKAIGQELVGHHDYTTILICTLPPGTSRWLKRNLVRDAERRFGLPVIHVV